MKKSILCLFIAVGFNSLIAQPEMETEVFSKSTYETFAISETMEQERMPLNPANKIAYNLQKHALYLRSIAEKIKADTVNRCPEEKREMIAEAKALLKSSITEQIKGAELLAKIRHDNYNLNKKTFILLINLNKNDIDITACAEIYILDAEVAWKIAQEMYEEANAEESKEAKLGAMGNAEEKELIALSNQTSAIKLLDTLRRGD
jgi:hypothetical protein